ncbi:calcium-binding protein KRP1-like [Rutidosis leptorrhynchoides]|uniref:calcium-binding protein KRP1-like n=1 Tax=Rutidosis leptorrhynchoides TaxID=125765 RepID=UPI003A99911E
MASNNQCEFHDLLPIMADKLGGELFMEELCNGFQMLMDPVKRVITFDSLKKNAVVLGLEDLTNDDLLSMLKEGDYDGDGVLNQMEFCVLMFRLSPDLMKESRFLLEQTLHDEKEV